MKILNYFKFTLKFKLNDKFILISNFKIIFIKRAKKNKEEIKNIILRLFIISKFVDNRWLYFKIFIIFRGKSKELTLKYILKDLKKIINFSDMKFTGSYNSKRWIMYYRIKETLKIIKNKIFLFKEKEIIYKVIIVIYYVNDF